MFLIFHFIFVIHLTNVIRETYAGFDNHVAFYCGYPSKIFRKDQWVVDFQQSCIKDEFGIVSYCQRTFPDKQITSAEPAMKALNFTKWCDFNNEKCKYNVKVRPFKCLERYFQSDALLLPKRCLFGHLGGTEDCKSYKDWIIDAKSKCFAKSNWSIQSYGMLFQCGKTQSIITPMFFKGIEFICCPPEKNYKKGEVNKQHIYNSYLRNGISQTEEDEEKLYEEAHNKLELSENEIKNDIIRDYKKDEKRLKKLWKSNPNFAKFKENNLIAVTNDHKRLVFGLISGILTTAFVIIVLALISIMYYYRSTIFKYTQPKSKHAMYGFRKLNSNDFSEELINSQKLNIYENLAFKVKQITLSAVSDI